LTSGASSPFFSGSDSKYKKVLKVAGTIADYKVTEVTPDYVEWKSNNSNQVKMTVGMQMKNLMRENGNWWTARWPSPKYPILPLPMQKTPRPRQRTQHWQQQRRRRSEKIDASTREGVEQMNTMKTYILLVGLSWGPLRWQTARRLMHPQPSVPTNSRPPNNPVLPSSADQTVHAGTGRG